MLGLILLPKSEKSVGCEHDEDENCITGVVWIDQQCDERSAHQKVVQRVVILREKSKKSRCFFGLIQFVVPIPFSSTNDLVNRNTGIRTFLHQKAVFGGKIVPLFTHGNSPESKTTPRKQVLLNRGTINIDDGSPTDLNSIFNHIFISVEYTYPNQVEDT